MARGSIQKRVSTTTGVTVPLVPHHRGEDPMTKPTPTSLVAMRYAVYTRVSTSKQEETGTSLGSQLDACRDHAAARGGSVDPAHVYTDTASGAAWRERPALQSLLAAVRAGEVDVVLAYALDRLSRDQQHVAVIVDLIEEHGARVELVTEDFEQSAVGRFLRGAKAFVAEVEREKITERTVRGKLTRVRSGKVHNHGNDLYGYRRDKVRGVRDVHEPEAAVVRRIFAWAAAGDSLRGVVSRLNGEAVPSPAASKGTRYGRPTFWGQGAVRRILTEPAYKGEPSAWRWRRLKGGKVELRPKSEWIALPGDTTPAIVTSETFDVVSRRLAANKGADTRNAARPYLLRGLIVCEVCGRKMRTSPERGRRTYRCSSRETPAGACGGKRVDADIVEAWAWAETRRTLEDRSVIEAEIAARHDSGPDPALVAERASLARLIERAEGQQERLMHLLRDDVAMPVDLFRREIAAAEEEKRRLRGELATVDRQLAEDDDALASLQDVVDYCDAVVGHLDDADFDLKRLALEAVDAAVRADGRSFTLQCFLPGRTVGTATQTSGRCAPLPPRPQVPA